jgi:aspartate/methionine/tyrosine aminotransferase
VISKAFAIPGIRVGWLVCQNQELKQRVIDIKGYLSICNSQIDERLAAIILQKADKLLERNLKIIKKNKKLIESFNHIYDVKIDLIIPNSGCCFFALIDDQISVLSLIDRIINKNKYLLYPSTLFKTDVNALRIGFGSRNFEDFVLALQA